MANYENVTPIFENTTMQKVYINGVHRLYNITPVEGYVLRDNELDCEGIDPETGDTVIIPWYTSSVAQCLANYDFATNPREFYAVLESEVPDPENQILGGGNNNDHEIM